MAGSESTPSSIIENLNGISIREKGSKKPRGWRSPISGTVWNSPSPDIIRHGNHTRQYPTLKDSNGSNGSVKSLEKGEESGGAGNSLNGPAFSRDQGEAARLSVKRKKDFMCMERVKGKMINILEGLELHTGVFSAAEQKRIVDYVYEIQEMGRKRQLRDRTYSEPRKWMRGKGRVTIQFGCCYNYATDKDGNPPGIIRDEDVDPLPPLFKSMIKRMVEWHVLPPTCIPNSCIVNIYDKDDCIPPHIDHHDFVRPFCTVSFLTQCNILFGTELKVLGPGDFSGSTAIPLPMGTCVKDCEDTGAIGEIIIPHCQFSHSDSDANSSWYMQEPLYLQWKQLNCRSDCRYHCMMQRESEREKLGLNPVQYHGKWPFKRLYVFQEPASVAFSALNLVMHFTGWLSFFMLVNYKLPLRPQSKRTYYEYTGLWHIFGLLSMNAWLWSSIFHTRDFDLTEKLDYSSAVALLGYSFILALLRTFNVKDEASRVMFAAPILAFVTTHILYLNFYELDYGWNITVCTIMGVGQLLVWAIWAGVSCHPSRFKLWTIVVLGGALGVLLEVKDFPPYYGYLDAHALWHAITIPLTFLLWSFIKSDAELRTSMLLKKMK